MPGGHSASQVTPYRLPAAQPENSGADNNCSQDGHAADGKAGVEAEVVNQVTQDWGQYPGAFHIAEEIETEHCGAVSG